MTIYLAKFSGFLLLILSALAASINQEAAEELLLPAACLLFIASLSRLSQNRRGPMY